MDIEKIIEWTLKNGASYPGKHNYSTERTSPACKPLEPKSQMMIIWKSMIEYLNNNLRAGRSINIKKFGSFTFDIDTELPRIATKSINPNTGLDEQRMDRKHIHTVRPCFVVDEALQIHCTRYANKEEITPPKSQNSVFQKGFRMIYCNPVPIAAACLLGKDVVTDALSTIFLAIIDLVKFNRNIVLQFGFGNITITNKNLKVYFSDNFKQSIKDKYFENNMRRSTTPVSTIWKTSYTKTFAKSTLGSLIHKPNHEVVQTLNEKTLALKLMSLDMASSGKLQLSNKLSIMGKTFHSP